MIDAICPHCLGNKEVFDDAAQDWLDCADCGATGERVDAGASTPAEAL